MSQPMLSSSGAVVIDANILIAICSKDLHHQTAEDALDDYASRGWLFYAPVAMSFRQM
jgi:predicted nucleic acid-binding protein